ncbi:unnamed protein product [Haemonchus placei]|uniref:CHK domain-containing protein n=1 Tax=Haemonchus placei TaxID=6290 RepID=A0A0N4XAU2_HAEPC|nr:unnamed protein product [Haemonchus placei]
MPLNLYTPAEGLYRTHVTWADIEGDLQRELDTVASFGPNKAARDIGDNFGFMSKILLIQPDWQRRDKKLPRRFLVKGLDQLIVMFSASGDENFAEKGDQLKAILSDIVDVDWVVNMNKQFGEHISYVNGMESVLCHGDLWSNNILWKQKGNHLELVAVVDYQTAHFGCAATDLVRMFCGCLSGRDRREHWEQLLEEFYCYLKEEVGDRQMPYTLEQLKEAYQQFIPIGAFMALPGIGTVFQVLSETSDEDSRKKRMEIAMEKTGCLLDDIFLFHDRNKELRKEEQVE